MNRYKISEFLSIDVIPVFFENQLFRFLVGIGWFTDYKYEDGKEYPSLRPF
ncbi:hypothetical protein [Sutcliffiella deserti]|uniref:hypothetical protein n=1 Tax=Sutcliffiella deserti TaxID=2875501 RepID=UPI001CBC1493|nr:hypothetical protein [Sutcliffiella deserti]